MKLIDILEGDVINFPSKGPQQKTAMITTQDYYTNDHINAFVERVKREFFPQVTSASRACKLSTRMSLQQLADTLRQTQDSQLLTHAADVLIPYLQTGISTWRALRTEFHGNDEDGDAFDEIMYDIFDELPDQAVDGFFAIYHIFKKANIIKF